MASKTNTLIALDLRDGLRDLSNHMVDSGDYPNGPEVTAVLRAYHAIAGQFGYPDDLE